MVRVKRTTILSCFLIVFIAISACSRKQDAGKEVTSDTKRHTFAADIEQAHQMDNWKEKGVLKADLELNLGNALYATIYVETEGPGIMIELSDDTAAYFDGEEMYAMPNDTAVTPFTLKTWAYFLEAPYKLNDPGTKMEEQDPGPMKGDTYDRARLTFEPGTGDTPDDWYILYRDQSNNRLRAMAYIVTAGKSVEEANREPHAISYEDFQMVDGIPVATTWKFWGWSEQSGFSDEPIGEGKLRNITFLDQPSLFEVPDEAEAIGTSDE